MPVTVSIDDQEIAKLLSLAMRGPVAIQTKARQAVNRGLVKAKTEFNKEVRSQLDLRKANLTGRSPTQYVNERLTVKPSTGNATGYILVDHVDILTIRFLAGSFGTMQRNAASVGKVYKKPAKGSKGGGYKVRVKKGGSIKKMEGAFLIKLQAGRRRKAGVMGLAIPTMNSYKVLHSANVHQVLKNGGIARRLPVIREATAKELKRQIDRGLKQASRAASTGGGARR